MKNCITTNNCRMDAPGDSSCGRSGNPSRRHSRRNTKVLRRVGIYLLAVSLLLELFLLPNNVKAAQDGIGIRQMLQNAQGQEITASEDGTYPFTIEEQDGYLRLMDTLRVVEEVTLDLDALTYGYDSLAYLIAAEGPKTVTLVLGLDPVLSSQADAIVTAGSADVLSVDAHDNYVSVALSVRSGEDLTVQVPTRVSERYLEDIRLGYTIESRLSCLMWNGYVLTEEAVKAEPIRISPTREDTLFDLSARSTDLVDNFSATVALQIDASKVTPMDMVLIASDHEGAADLNQALATLKADLVDAGINLHEGLLPLEGRSLAEGIGLAVDELKLIARGNATKNIVVLVDSLSEEDELALTELHQQHPDYSVLIKFYPAAEDELTMEDLMGIIRDDLIRTVKAGSYIEATIAQGYTLLLDPSAVSLVVGGETIQAEAADREYEETYCFSFGENYKLHYYDEQWADVPYFVFEIGEDKLASDTLTLRFQVRLVRLQTPEEEGVTYYGTYDPYGLSSYDGIPVFGETRLVAKNALGEVERIETFPVPTVSYTALKLAGQYGSEEIHYFTSDMAGETIEYQIDDELFIVNIGTDGQHTTLDIE